VTPIGAMASSFWTGIESVSIGDTAIESTVSGETLSAAIAGADPLGA
jgi:hypothetical protein